MKNLSLETIKKDTIFAVELDDVYGRNWVTGTWEEVQWAYESEDFSDCDICATQPEHLKAFYDAYEKYQYGPECHGFTPLDEFYAIWAKEVAA